MNKLLMIIGMVLVLSFGCIQDGAGEAGAAGETGEVSESGQPGALDNGTGEEPAMEAGNESTESEPEGNESAQGEAPHMGLILEEAQQLALASSCIDEGPILLENYTYNNFTHTWWFEMDIEKPGCSPACVVDEETLAAQINWRCTGLIEN
jgi:hypothetical protein